MEVSVSVSSIIKHLMPNGTRGRSGEVLQYPLWPADIFAVCAYLLQQTDSYTYLQHPDKDCIGGIIRTSKSALEEIGKTWSKLPILEGDADKQVAALWKRLACSKAKLSAVSPKSAWIVYATKLLIISDVACKGIGFYKWQRDRMQGWIPAIYSLLNVEYLNSKEAADILNGNRKYPINILTLLEELSGAASKINERSALASACLMVPPELVCVHPKARTPMVGCTLRSLTHHLSLHPASGHLKSSWTMPTVAQESKSEKFNILVIPYPYEIGSECFSGTRRSEDSFGIFHIDQSWLKKECFPGQDIIGLVDSLYDSALKQFGEVDAVVFPEAALNLDTYNEIQEHLRRKSNGSKLLLIAGISGRYDNEKSFNAVRCVLINKKGDVSFTQRKHHRWALESSQIYTYDLGRKLNKKFRWWEDIQVDNREINYFVFRRGSCLATLICEDLARTDPCQASIRSVGPNILIALLMDGPQISGRWPERYAMGLADDPGTSVLSVTSMGLVQRSNSVLKKTSTTIGLWRDSKTGTKELSLGFGNKGLVLKLKSLPVEEETLDGRRDGRTSHLWMLDGYKGIS